MTPDRLTPREGQVLALIAAGLSNAELAARLGLAPATVRSHVRMAYRRIGVTRRVDALLWAHQHGLRADVVVPESASPLGPATPHPWGATRTEDHDGGRDQQHRSVENSGPGTHRRPEP